MADTLSMPLKFPITLGTGETLTALPIHRLKRKHLTAAHQFAKGDDAKQEDFMLAKVTGLTLEDLAELDMADNAKLAEVFREMADGGDGAKALGRSPVVGAAHPAE